MYRRYQQLNKAKKAPEKFVNNFISIHQNYLNFGSSRGTPVNSRPVLVYRVRDSHIVVLPGTTKPNKRFFYLDENLCIDRVKGKKFKDGYLSFRHETVPTSVLQEEKIICKLSSSAISGLFDWLKNNAEK